MVISTRSARRDSTSILAAAPTPRENPANFMDAQRPFKICDDRRAVMPVETGTAPQGCRGINSGVANEHTGYKVPRDPKGIYTRKDTAFFNPDVISVRPSLGCSKAFRCQRLNVI